VTDNLALSRLFEILVAPPTAEESVDIDQENGYD